VSANGPAQRQISLVTSEFINIDHEYLAALMSGLIDN
jgi:hypothetical protein